MKSSAAKEKEALAFLPARAHVTARAQASPSKAGASGKGRRPGFPEGSGSQLRDSAGLAPASLLTPPRLPLRDGLAGHPCQSYSSVKVRYDEWTISTPKAVVKENCQAESRRGSLDPRAKSPSGSEDPDLQRSRSATAKRRPARVIPAGLKPCQVSGILAANDGDPTAR